MKKAIQMTGKTPPTPLNKRIVNNNKGSKQTTSQELGCAPIIQDRSPPNKKKVFSTPSTAESAEFIELAERQLRGVRQEEDIVKSSANKDQVSMLFLEFAQALSESATADTSQMKELEGILAEARNLESYLIEKKENLRKTLSVISQKLQG